MSFLHCIKKLRGGDKHERILLLLKEHVLMPSVGIRNFRTNNKHDWILSNVRRAVYVQTRFNSYWSSRFSYKKHDIWKKEQQRSTKPPLDCPHSPALAEIFALFRLERVFGWSNGLPVNQWVLNFVVLLDSDSGFGFGFLFFFNLGQKWFGFGFLFFLNFGQMIRIRIRIRLPFLFKSGPFTGFPEPRTLVSVSVANLKEKVRPYH